jgi:outer membrane biosynthesis protein TonB
MRVLLAALLFVFLGGAVSAQEDDDDPKSAHTAALKPAAKVEAKPAPKVEPKVEAKPAPKVEARVEAKPAPKPAPKPEPKVEPRPEPKSDPKLEPKPEPVVAKVDAKRPAPKAEPKPEPKPLDAPPAGRSVRVRLFDGSSVSGTVRAELSESLVIDCNLGLLSIPRARISTVAYDVAGSAKRAPVQALDDDLPPRKR